MRRTTPTPLWSAAAGVLAFSVGCSSDSTSDSPGSSFESTVPESGSATEQASSNDSADSNDASNPAGSPVSEGMQPTTASSNEEAIEMRLPLSEPAETTSSDSNGEAADPTNEDPTAPQDEDPIPEGVPPLPAPATFCSEGPFADSPITPQSTPEIVCDGMNFIEGAVWFAERNTLFFSDIVFGAPGNAGTIFRFTPGGACEPFVEQAGTNGLLIAPDGNLLGMRHGDRTLTVFDLETRNETVLVADFEGGTLSGPNDGVLRSDGNLYFTDPNYGLGVGQNPLPPRAYRRDPEGNLSVIDSGANANGISLSPAEDRLYLSHLGGGAEDVIVFPVNEDGSLGTPTPFVDSASDGMTVDCAGNLYLTNGNVQIFDPEGQLLGTLDTPGAANVAFGGPDRRTLYVTATDRLYAVPMGIEGMPY